MTLQAFFQSLIGGSLVLVSIAIAVIWVSSSNLLSRR